MTIRWLTRIFPLYTDFSDAYLLFILGLVHCMSAMQSEQRNYQTDYFNVAEYARQPAFSPRRAYRAPVATQMSSHDSFSFHRTPINVRQQENNQPSFVPSSEALKMDSTFGLVSSEEASAAACRSLPGLSDHQRILCLRNPGLVWAMVDGTQLGLYECVHQFRLDKWNCSAAKVIYFIQGGGAPENTETQRDTKSVSTSGNLVSGLQGILKQGSRETAFISAAWAAGAVQAITRACSRGRISTCDCDPLRREGKSKDSEGDFTWGGCSDPIRFGMRLTRLFLDSADLRLREQITQRERELKFHARTRRIRGSDEYHGWHLQRISRNSGNSSFPNTREPQPSAMTLPQFLRQMEAELSSAQAIKARVLMDLHNRKAGRRLVWQQREKKCKCHGVSGACSLRTCWQRVSQFRQVGNMLKKAYGNAVFAAYDVTSGKLLRSNEAYFSELTDTFSGTGGRGSRPPSSLPSSSSSKWRNQDLKWLVSNSGMAGETEKPVWQQGSKRSYSAAVRGGTDKLRFRERSLKRYKDMLIYLESSPDYCNVDPIIGHLGVAGRQCSAKLADKVNGCDHVCCGRGFETIETETREKCDCKFVWCCEVKCNTCHRKTLLHRCKSRKEDDQLSEKLHRMLNISSDVVNQAWARQKSHPDLLGSVAD